MKDYSEYKSLYLLCFTEDTEEDAEFLFKNLLSKANCVCKYDGERLISMLFLMDADLTLKGTPYPYYYLYAACTHPDYRGKGIMGELLRSAEQEAIKNNKQGIFLKPANKSLFDFYARYGFAPYFKVCKINTTKEAFISVFKPEASLFTKVSLEKWCSLRKEYLKNLSDGYVDFNTDTLTTAADGSVAISSKNFGFVYEKRDDTLLVKEALCKKGHTDSLFSSISHIAQSTNSKELEIRLPSILNKEITAIQTTVEDFSVIKLTPDTTMPEADFSYHGFAFE